CGFRQFVKLVFALHQVLCHILEHSSALMKCETSHVRVADASRVIEHSLEVQSFARCLADFFAGDCVNQVCKLSGSLDPFALCVALEFAHFVSFHVLYPVCCFGRSGSTSRNGSVGVRVLRSCSGSD